MSSKAESVWLDILKCADAQTCLGRLKKLLFEDGLSHDERLRLLLGGIERMGELSRDVPTVVLDAIQHVLMPALAMESEGNERNNRELEMSLREQIPALLNGLARQDRASIQGQCIALIRSEIFSDSVERATLAHSIIRTWGFRDKELYAGLIEQIKKGGQQSNETLQTIICLSVPIETRKAVKPYLIPAIVPNLKSRILMQEVIRQGWRDDDVSNAVVQAIFSHPVEGDQFSTTSLWMSLLGSLALERSDSAEWQSQLWKKVAELHESRSRPVLVALELTGQLASSFGNERVIRDMLQWHSGNGEVPRGRLWRVYLRLSECVQPSHMSGWEAARSADGAWRQVLSDDTCQDTGAKGRGQTLEMMAKESAWETALCLGLKEVCDWGIVATSEETNPYIAGQIMEKIACLDAAPFPPPIHEQIKTRFDFSEDESGEIHRITGAITLARGAANWKAFDALAEAGFNMREHVMISVCDALADVAVKLFSEDPDRVLEVLWGKTSVENPGYIQDAAILAIRKLAERGSIGTESIANLISFASNARKPFHTRVAALEAVRFVIRGEDEANLDAHDFKAIATESDETDVCFAAADILASCGRLTDLTAKELLTTYGVEWNGSEWLFREVPDSRALFTLALLYGKNEGTASKLVAELIRRVEGHGVYSLFGSDRVRGSRTPIEVAEAIVDRIRTKTTPYSVETPMFSLLGEMAPELLLNTRWEDEWDGWHPDGRTALLDAIGRLSPNDTIVPDRVVVIARRLADDGLYSVRRSAYRAMAEHATEWLEILVKEWCEGGVDVDYRKRAAEACVWLSPNEELPSTIAELLVDPEADVRQIAQASCHERRERRWCRQYIQSIIEGINGGKPVLELYRYGHALGKIGDNGDQAELAEYVAKGALRPNQEIWLFGVLEAMQRHWRDVTSKWPEPWTKLEGTIEKMDAVVNFDGDDYEVEATLWVTPRTEPSGMGEWGGIVKLPESFNQFKLIAMPKQISIQIQGRSNAVALPGRLSSGLLMIHGQDAYPSNSIMRD